MWALPRSVAWWLSFVASLYAAGFVFAAYPISRLSIGLEFVAFAAWLLAMAVAVVATGVVLVRLGSAYYAAPATRAQVVQGTVLLACNLAAALVVADSGGISSAQLRRGEERDFAATAAERAEVVGLVLSGALPRVPNTSGFPGPDTVALPPHYRHLVSETDRLLVYEAGGATHILFQYERATMGNFTAFLYRADGNPPAPWDERSMQAHINHARPLGGGWWLVNVGIT